MTAVKEGRKGGAARKTLCELILERKKITYEIGKSASRPKKRRKQQEKERRERERFSLRIPTMWRETLR